MFCSNEEELLRAAGGCQRTEPPMLQDGALGVVTSLPDQTSGTNSSNSSLPVATRFHRVSLWRRDLHRVSCGDEIFIVSLVATRFHRVSLWRRDSIVSLVGTRFHLVSCGDEISSCLLW